MTKYSPKPIYEVAPRNRANAAVAVSKVMRSMAEPIEVDWDAAISRFKTMMAEVYADE